MSMNTETASAPAPAPAPARRREPVPMNGVDTPTLFGTIDHVKQNPDLAKFQFRATNKWISGTHSRSTMLSFYGAGAEMAHKQAYQADADHVEVLVGSDEGPTPVEYLLHALAACLTAGIGNIASARGIALESVESSVEGNINLLGLLGLSDDVRNGYEGIKISFKIRGDASAEKLQAIIEQSRKRSAVYDVLTNGVPVDIEVDAG